MLPPIFFCVGLMAADKTTLRVAAVQIETALGDVATNLRKHTDWIDSARVEGADIVLFRSCR